MPAAKAGLEVGDEIVVRYETRTWAKPAKLRLEEVARHDGIATLEARMLGVLDRWIERQTALRTGHVHG